PRASPCSVGAPRASPSPGGPLLDGAFPFLAVAFLDGGTRRPPRRRSRVSRMRPRRRGGAREEGIAGHPGLAVLGAGSSKLRHRTIPATPPTLQATTDVHPESGAAR